MVVFAVDIVGNCATDRHQLGAGCYWQHPAARYSEALDVAQQHTRFAYQTPVVLVEGDEMV